MSIKSSLEQVLFSSNIFYDTTLNSSVLTGRTVRVVKRGIKKFMVDKKQIKLVVVLVNVFLLAILHVHQSEFLMPQC